MSACRGLPLCTDCEAAWERRCAELRQAQHDGRVDEAAASPDPRWLVIGPIAISSVVDLMVRRYRGHRVVAFEALGSPHVVDGLRWLQDQGEPVPAVWNTAIGGRDQMMAQIHRLSENDACGVVLVQLREARRPGRRPQAPTPAVLPARAGTPMADVGSGLDRLAQVERELRDQAYWASRPGWPPTELRR